MFSFKLTMLATLVVFGFPDGKAIEMRSRSPEGATTSGVVGENAILSCDFELGPGEGLYSVRWFKDGEEFYRFKPRESPFKFVFPIRGVILDRNISGMKSVMLGPLTLESAGTYLCEVTGDSVQFPSVLWEQELLVLDKENVTDSTNQESSTLAITA